MTEYPNRHPIEGARPKETHDEEYVINILAKLFKLNQKYGQFLNRKFRSTDQSKNVTSKTNRELTNKIVSPRTFITDDNAKGFTSEEAQAINSVNTNFYPITKTTNFDFTDSNMEK